MAANTTIAEELRRKLESMAGPDKSADDLANEAISAFIAKVEQDRDWRDLVTFGRKNGAASGYTEADVADLIKQTRSRR
jgi:hypothetical protein